MVHVAYEAVTENTQAKQGRNWRDRWYNFRLNWYIASYFSLYIMCENFCFCIYLKWTNINYQAFFKCNKTSIINQEFIKRFYFTTSKCKALVVHVAAILNGNYFRYWWLLSSVKMHAKCTKKQWFVNYRKIAPINCFIPITDFVAIIKSY